MDNAGDQLVDQLVFDPSFRDWVLGRPGADTERWNDWEKQHGAQAELIGTAKAIVLALQLKKAPLSRRDIEDEVLRIRSRMENRVHGRRIWLRVAAIFLLLALGLGWLLVRPRQEDARSTGLSPVEQLPVYGRYENLSDTIVRIRLPDQSVVFLNGNSTIRYRYQDGRREVNLSGEAFFEVSRQPARPFLVYGGEIVTRVLGTSFRVRVRPGERQAEVSVKTGKVYVAKKGDASTALILSPNQRVKYDKTRNSLEKGLVDAPAPVWEPIEREEQQELFHFESTPLQKVFEDLQKVYGIPIIYDERIVASCSLSATMGDEPFFEKLELICRVVNASYEILDGSVVIYAKGCR